MVDEYVNIRFCEPAYTRSEYIAEFWNTLTSFAYCIPPVVMYFQVIRYKNAHPKFFSSKTTLLYFLCGFSWCFLAAGSAIFHATQTGWGEALDEIGMILASCSCCFSLADIHPLTTSRLGASFYIFFAIFIIISSIVYLKLASHSFFSVFFIVSLLIQVFLVASIPVTVRKYNKNVYFEEELNTANDLNLSTPLDIQQWLKLGFLMAIAGYAIWHVDQRCVHQGWRAPSEYAYELIWYYWTHPLWHILTAAGALCYMQAILLARVETFNSPLARNFKTGSFVLKSSISKVLFESFGLKQTSESKKKKSI